MQRLRDQRIGAPEIDGQTIAQLEVGRRRGGIDGRGRGLHRQWLRLATGRQLGQRSISFAKQRIELRHLSRVLALLVFAETEDVGVVRRAPAVEEEIVLARQHGAQRGDLRRCPLAFTAAAPAQITANRVGPLLQAGSGGMDAVEGQRRGRGNQRRRVNETCAAFLGHRRDRRVVTGQQLTQGGGIRQARPAGAQVLGADRGDQHHTYRPTRSSTDGLDQLVEIFLEPCRGEIIAIARDVGIERPVVGAVGHFLQRRRHAVADDRHRRFD